MKNNRGEDLGGDFPVNRSEKGFHVALISIFGRGNWLATELSRRGLRVVLMDLDPQFLGSHFEKVRARGHLEGPFGFFHPESLGRRPLPSQMERLQVSGGEQKMENGFTLWVKSGPLELRGPLGAFRLGSLSRNSLDPSYSVSIGLGPFDSADDETPWRDRSLEGLSLKGVSLKGVSLEDLRGESPGKGNLDGQVENWVESRQAKGDLGDPVGRSTSGSVGGSTKNPEEYRGPQWLRGIAGSLSSSVFHTNWENIEGRGTWPLPLFSEFWMRHWSSDGDEKSLDWCRQNGVHVLNSLRLVDLVAHPSEGVELVEYRSLDSETSSVLSADQFVWSLNSEETVLLGENFRSKLFSRGTLEPEWVWISYEVKIGSCLEREQLPPYLVMIEDLDLSWTHDNLLVLKQKKDSEEVFEVWIRIPAIQRFNRQYLSEHKERILKLLSSRMPNSFPEVLEDPEGASYVYQQIGPSLFPVYSDKSNRNWLGIRAGGNSGRGRGGRSRGKGRSPGKQFHNLHYDSSEQWDHLSWEGRFCHQESILSQLGEWWMRQESLRLEREKRGDHRTTTV